MLRIHTVTSSTEAKRYYASSDYYSEGQELVGEWGGKLARELGLSGTVDKVLFDRMCDNLHPKSGLPLTPRTNIERRVGYDFVFSAPKSFSVLEALAGEGDRRQLLAAFDASVEETMREAEADMRTRVRQDGRDTDRVTGNMAWATFRHSTSRPVGDEAPDPHRHTHVLVFNATRDATEGRIKAGQFASIKRDGEYYTASFYSRLARRLEKLGYAIDRRGGKEWEIAGVPQSVIETFSKRTQQVEEEAERLGITDLKQKSELGAKTREKKQKELTPDELRTMWDAQLTEPEWEALAHVYARRAEGAGPVSVEEAVAFSLLHCLEREAVVPETEIRQHALLFGLGSVTPDALAAEMSRQGVISREVDGRVMATTREVLGEERFITGFAAFGRGSVRPAGIPAGLSRGTLDDDQWEAVLGLLGSTDRVNLIDSAAGTGKSTMLTAFDRGLKRSGEKVTYLATSAQATELLRKEGFAAETVAAFLASEKKQQAAAGGRLVVDEASMLGHSDAVRLFRAARDGDMRLDLLGDSRQHASVGRGALMRILREYSGLTPFRLSRIKRQEESGYRGAVELFASGKPVEGFDALDQLGWVKELPEGEREQAIAADYLTALKEAKKWDDVLVISPTHAEGERITGSIREALKADGRLGGEEREFTRLVAANLTEAERSDPASYRSGRVDLIQFHQNARGHERGSRLAVAGKDAAALPLAEAAKFQAYRVETINLTPGDVIRFTSGGKTVDRKHRLDNGAAYRVAGFAPRGDIRLNNGWVVSRDFGHFRHGFVETSFGAQGRTVSHVIIGQSSQSLPASNAEQIYVSASRARRSLRLYTDNKEELREAIVRSSQKVAASDLVAGKPLAKRRHIQLRKQAQRSVLERTRRAYETPQRPAHTPERQVAW